MDVLIIYCDTASPARYLRYLEAGMYHQVLADAGLRVNSTLLHADRHPDEIIAAFRQSPARLVAFFIDEFNFAPTLRLARQLRSQFTDTPLVGIGILPALAPDRIMREGTLDYLLVGEAEVALYELATAIASAADVASIKNLWWRHGSQIHRNPLRPLHENLDTIPYPNRSLFDQEPQLNPGSERVLYVCATRGCVYDCQFCYIPVLKHAYGGKGTFYRMRSPQHLAGEILGELRRREYSCITFVDEQFPTDKNWLRTLTQRLGTGAAPFQAVVAVERCDIETLDLLKAAGCERVVLGLESGNESFRRRIAARNLGNDRVRAFAVALRERGIGLITSNMVGLPLESDQLVQETYAFNQELAPDEVRAFVYQPIEGTPLHQYAADKQYIAADAAAEPDFTHLSMRLPELSADAVRGAMYRMHFLNVGQRLRALPPGEGYFDFLREVPRAKFKMSHSGAVDVRSVRSQQPFGYLAVETGSEVRYAVELAPQSQFRFRLHLPEASIQRLQHANTRVLAEIIWFAAREEHVVFGRLVGPRDLDLTRGWVDCVANGPEHGASGELIFRVSSWPDPDLKAFVFFGAPTLLDSLAQRRSSGEHAAFSDTAPAPQPTATQARIAELEQQLSRAAEREATLRNERDQKVHRIGELQVRILELEKELASRPAQTPAEPAIADRLKGIFRK